MRFDKNVCVVGLAFSTLTTAQQTTTNSPTVTIAKGPIRGRSTQLPGSDTTINQFLGIPLAQPPTSSLRWLPPQEPDGWSTALDVTSQPDGCLQYYGRSGPARDFNSMLFNNPPLPSQSEDCLYLNVYAPQGGVEHKAVLFWVYGGSNLIGGAAMPLYDGSSFAANQDIIVVVPNYRLNGESRSFI